jgi:hypothetical protein
MESVMKVTRQCPQAKPRDLFRWVNDLSDDGFGQMFGPAWSQMTVRQRLLYPNGLSESEKDGLWGMGCSRDAAA